MDALKAEIVAKRKAIEEVTLHAARPTKYMRRGDIEKLRDERDGLPQEADTTSVGEPDKVCYTTLFSSKRL
jgi:pre-mRNA-splicing factor 18